MARAMWPWERKPLSITGKARTRPLPSVISAEFTAEMRLTSISAASETQRMLLVSADVKGFHYDTNYLFQRSRRWTRFAAPSLGRRSRFHTRCSKKFGLSGEIWHFTQPFLTQQCRRHPVGAELQCAQESCARLRLQSRTHQYVHTLGSICRIHLSAAAQGQACTDAPIH